MTAYSKLAMEQLQSKKPAVSPILLLKVYCKKCEVYFATQVAKRSHLCEVHDTAESEDTEDIPVVDGCDDDTFPVITNLKTWLRSEFEDC